MKYILLALVLPAIGTAARGDDQMQTQRYRLNSGDSISLEYRFTPEFNQTAVIQPDGFVTLSIGGELKLSGLTLAQAHDLIVQRAAARLNGPELNVILKEPRALSVTVSGEVEKPGRVAFHEQTTVLQSILLAGGFKQPSQRSQIIIFRRVNEQVLKTVELDLHKAGKPSPMERDATLEPGDIVLVPRNKLRNVPSIIKSADLGQYLQP